jgi:hypothetical protein
MKQALEKTPKLKTFLARMVKYTVTVEPHVSGKYRQKGQNDPTPVLNSRQESG